MNNETLNGMNFHVYLCLLYLLLISGCATPSAIISLNKVDSYQLSQRPFGVIVLVPEKGVRLNELMYRVLWNETSTNYYTFEGIWDPSAVLKDNLVKTLHERHNLITIPLWEKLEPKDYNRLVEKSEAYFIEAMKEPETYITAGASYKLPMKYLLAKPSENIMSLKDSPGIDYILELSLSGILIHHAGIARIYVDVYGRLIRLSDGSVIWIDVGRAGHIINSFNNFSELEKNNLELLKKHYGIAVENIFNPDKARNAYIFKSLVQK